MKRRFTILTAAIALLTILAFPMGMWGQTWELATSIQAGDVVVLVTEYDDMELTGISSTSTKYGIGTSYETVPAATYPLTVVAGYSEGTFAFKNGNNYLYWTSGNSLNVNSSLSNNTSWTVSFDGTNATITNKADATRQIWWNVSSPRFACYTGKTHGDAYHIVSLYKQVVNVNAVATPTFSPNGGSFVSPQEVTITCDTEGTTIYYTLDGTDPDDESTEYTAPITVSETTTIKAIAYDGDGNTSNIASATYTILMPMTIAEVREQGTGAVYTSGTVTSCVGTTGYIQDATAAICVFGTSLTIGDNISVQGSLTTYNGLLEITNPVVTVISSGNTVEPEVMTIAEINASTNQGWYVRIENATVTNIDGDNTTISQEGNSILVYKITGVELEVNDIVSLNGNIGNHNGIQIANPKDVTIQQSEEPAILVDPTTVNVPCTAAEGTLTVTYQSIDGELGAEIYWYESDGTTAAEYDWVTADFNENGNIDYIIDANTGEARLAYMKVYGISTGGDDVYSELITFSQGHYVADYATLPFEFDGGKADIEGTAGLTQEGLGSDYSSSPKLKFDGTGDWLLLQFNERPGTLTFDIKGNSFSGGTFKVQTSADGVSYSDLETYTSFGNNETFEEIFDNLDENVRYIKWVYTEKVSGNVGLGNIALAKYVLVPSITVTPTEVNISAEGATGALTVTCENIDDSYEIGVRFYSDPQTPATDPAIYEDWFEIVPAGGSSNDFHYEAYSNEGDARTAYLTICAFAANGEMLTESQLVTVNQSAPVVPATGDEYALYTGELVEGDYLIVYNGGAMNNTVSSNRLQYESVTVTNDAITTDNAAIVWHIAPSGDYWTLYNVDANAYAASTGTKNQAQMLADGTDDKALWTVSGTETYEFVNKKNAASSVNANLRKNGTYGFACYATSTGGALSLYKKVVEPETHTLYIPGYSNATNPKGGYYLIASPVTVNPEDVEGDPQGMIDGNFDLYYFDQAEENEWRNYEAQPFNLVPGKGYLYAHDTDVELTFTGTPYSGNREFPLSYTEDAVFAGWNLIGNPYNYNVTVDKDFYIMNEDGDEIITPEEGMPILPMQGFFVVATAAGQTVTFSKYVAPVVPLDELVMNLSQNRGTVIDRAIVRFGEGEQLPKFQLFENSTKLYIPQGNSDYAIVRSAAEGEMPVNFKAKENGTYTISVNTENVEMDYLHLIDNMTGTDVDLLQTPSYTFEASTRDYASRFRLVFSAEENGASAGSATFAYFNGNEWVVSNEGDAQLHVIDMTGRIVSTETINGNATVKVNAAPGVYMLRLVNGNDIKTQKVIIK